MRLQKGFSLIEVLLSLMLVATLAFSLLEQHNQFPVLLQNLAMRSDALFILDEINESVLLNEKTKFKVPNSYELSINNNHNELLSTISWFNHSLFMQRITQY